MEVVMLRLVRRMLPPVAGMVLLSICAWGQTSVSVSPASRNALPSSTVSVNVTIANVANMHGYNVIVTFNPAILQYTGAAPGTFVNSFLFFPTHTGAGTLNVSHALVGNGTVVSGSGTLFTLTFSTLTEGTSPVTISSVDLRDGANNPIVPVTLNSGSITVARPSVVYVNASYTAGNAGGHEFGFDAFATVSQGVAAAAAGGIVNIAAATYNESVTLTKTLTLACSGNPTIQHLTLNTPNITLGGDLQVSGVLTLSSGVLSTGVYTLRVTNDQPGGVVAGGGVVHGTLCRNIAAGNTGIYQFTSTHSRIVPAAAQSAATICFTSYPGQYPPSAPAGTAINRYYSITTTPSDFTAGELRLEFIEAENIHSIPRFNWGLFRNNSSAWVPIGGVPAFGSEFYVLAGDISTWSLWAIGDIANPLPVQLVSFTGRAINGSDVRLTWRTVSETNNLGFEVQRAPVSGEFQTLPGSFIPGHGTTSVPHDYQYTDAGVGPGMWRYRLVQLDLGGARNYSDPIPVDVVTDVRSGNIPGRFHLHQNSPNPFNPSTRLTFELPEAGPVALGVYSMLGVQVAVIVAKEMEAGVHNIAWEAVSDEGRSLPSGVYLLVLRAGEQQQTRKIMLLK